MPSKYSLKVYVEDGIYHVYNRGVDKRSIFVDEQDYKVFLSYLKRYLTKLDKKDEVGPRLHTRWKKGLDTKIHLLAYCLMENHFHLILKQISRDAITTFMRCIMNSYTKYFNKKYERVGPLFQGKFKALLVDKDDYLFHLTTYIHLNPIAHRETITRSDLEEVAGYSYSSYQDYLGDRNTSWVKKDFVLDFFSKLINDKLKNYKNFVEEFTVDSVSRISGYIIESETLKRGPTS